MILVFSASMAFKYALASQPTYMKEFLSVNTSNPVGSSNSFPVELLKATVAADHVVWFSMGGLTPEQYAIKIFWGVFFGLGLTMAAVMQGVGALNSAVMTQMQALQPTEILKAGEGQVQRHQLWKLLEIAKTVYASKDCIPAECLSLTVEMFLIVGFVEGAVALASVVVKHGDIQTSFWHSPELFVTTLGTVVPLAFFIRQAADGLVRCNDKLQKCKRELKVAKRDFEKMSAMLEEDKEVPSADTHETPETPDSPISPTSDDMEVPAFDRGFQAAMTFVEQELDDLRPATFFGLPYSRGSRLVFVVVLPACQLGAALFQALRLAHAS